MKIVQINSTFGIGSTGKICRDISEMLSENGIENYSLYTLGESDAKNAIKCSNIVYTKSQAIKSRIFGNYGFNSKCATKKMISELEKIHPDIVHLHNIHSHDCNLEMLFKYFKCNNTKLIWTFHDCWSFTAYCTHFTLAKCDKWRNGCYACPKLHDYSFWRDRSRELYQRKKDLFSGLNLTIVTPSKWLADLVEISFFGNYQVRIINNGIDLNIFKPTESRVRAKYCIHNKKKVVLGVAFDWGYCKGLDVFIDLTTHLDEKKYQIILVGTNDEIDKILPSSIISIHKTHNQKELAEIYSIADVFVNPTREEVLGLVNLEALACGTPVITYQSGGSPEGIDETCGSVVEIDNIESLKNEIIRICETKPYSVEKCTTHAKSFDKCEKYKEYIKLYQSFLL